MNWLSEYFGSLKDTTTGLFEGIGEFFSNIKSIFEAFANLIKQLFTLLPSPFWEIGLTFVSIWIFIIAYKLWKGK